MNPMTDVRANPDEAFIARMRATYEVEPEVDHVLTRKLRRRAQPGRWKLKAPVSRCRSTANLPLKGRTRFLPKGWRD